MAIKVEECDRQKLGKALVLITHSLALRCQNFEAQSKQLVACAVKHDQWVRFTSETALSISPRPMPKRSDSL